jgi:uncharacterized protein
MSRRTRATEGSTAHRPWPMPTRPWVMFQSWRSLLFAHWPVPVEALRSLVPRQLEIETFDGSAWVGLTPFWLTGLRPRLGPAVPGLSSFPEMNLRTYVRVDDKPGIHFFTLEASSRLAVTFARLTYRLPYHHARMSIDERDGWISYESRRRHGAVAFAGRYRPMGAVFRPAPGSLEHFVTERYCLYRVLDRGWILRAEIHHRPWSLQWAEAEIHRNTVAAAHGITLPRMQPLLHFAERQDTLIWPPERVRPAAARFHPEPPPPVP